MNDFELSRNLTRPIRGAIIVMLVLTFIAAFIPLWQIGASSSASAVGAVSERRVADADAEGRALRAAIAAGIPAIEEEMTVRAGTGYQS